MAMIMTTLPSIPQEMYVSVTRFSYLRNMISVINNTSFPLYTELHVVNLDRNPLVVVKAGVFDNNPLFIKILCYVCDMASFPPDFGLATNIFRIDGADADFCF